MTWNNRRAKADYLAKIGDKEGATAAYEVTEKKTAGAAQKLDLVFSLMRSASLFLQIFPCQVLFPSPILTNQIQAF